MFFVCSAPFGNECKDRLNDRSVQNELHDEDLRTVKMKPRDQQAMTGAAKLDLMEKALHQILNQIAPAFIKQSESTASDSMSRIDHCLELAQTEASLAASWIAECVPEGRPRLAQAQQTIKSLESLKFLAQMASRA